MSNLTSARFEIHEINKRQIQIIHSIFMLNFIQPQLYDPEAKIEQKNNPTPLS